MLLEEIEQSVDRDTELRALMRVESTLVDNDAPHSPGLDSIIDELRATASKLGIGNLTLTTTTEYVVVSFE